MASNFLKLSPTYLEWEEKHPSNAILSRIIDSLFQFMDKRYSIELDKNQLRKGLARIGVSTSPKTIHLALSAINLTVAYLNEGQEQTRMIKEEERAFIPLRCLQVDGINDWNQLVELAMERKPAECISCAQFQQTISDLEMELSEKDKKYVTLENQLNKETKARSNLEKSLESAREENMALVKDNSRLQEELAKAQENQDNSVGMVTVSLNKNQRIMVDLASKIGFSQLPIYSPALRKSMELEVSLLEELYRIRLNKERIKELESVLLGIKREGINYLRKTNATRSIGTSSSQSSVYKIKFYQHFLELELQEEKVVFQKFYRIEKNFSIA